MGIKIIRLKGLHSNQKGFWDILQKLIFILGVSYYEFQRRATKKIFMKFWQRAAEIWDSEDGQNCDFPSLISQQPYVRTSWNFFWWLSYYNSQFDIPWPCLGTSPFLRKKTWLKPWKSKNATFSGLVLWHGWDFGHGPKEDFGHWVSIVPHTEFGNFPTN